MSRSHAVIRSQRRVLALSTLAASVALALMAAPKAHAFEFTSASGEVTGSFDTTLSIGGLWRMQDRDRSLIGITNGGAARSVNEDDGNLNYDKGDMVSLAFKATHDLELNYHNYGAFVRASYFYDHAVMNKSGLSDAARSQTGRDFELLDAYVRGRFDVGGRALNVRLGNQVVNWGESTFIQNGINVLNPVNVSRLRIPGSELREGLIPTNMLWASQDLTDRLSVEATLMLEWEKTKIDPAGTFFSNNDYLSPGANNVFVGFGRRKDLGTLATNPVPPVGPSAALYPVTEALAGPFDPEAAVWAPRGPDRKARDGGQFGIAARYFADHLNNTEFGLYHIRYHSRVPFASGVKGEPTTALTGTGTVVPVPVPGVGVVNLPLDQVLSQRGTARYFADYPEDIRLWGISFNTPGPAGIALQGEYSYRPNQPLQIAAPELLLAALGQTNQIPGTDTIPVGGEITGYRRVKMHQLQLSATKALPQLAGADQVVMVGEVGYTRLSLPSGIPFNVSGVYLPAPRSATQTSFGSTQSYFATESSWGYRLVARADYTNILAGGTVSPRVAFAHDVNGRSPTFNEGAKALTFGVGVNYRQNWQADIAYTAFFGGKTISGTDPNPNPAAGFPAATQSPSYSSSTNPLKDRDFLSVSVSYSF